MGGDGPRQRMRFPFMALGLLCLLPIAPPRAFAAPKLRVILIGDTLAKDIGPSVKTDLENVSETLTSMVPHDVLVLTTVDGRLTHTAIVETIRSAQVDPSDAFLVYYSGHGRFDASRNDHFCVLPTEERLYRSDMLAAMTSRGARLKILLTDTCSILLSPIVRPSAGVPHFTKLPILLRTLFFDSSGTVDISATRPGEEAAGLRTIGGCFTYSLMAVLKTNPDQALTWDAVLRQVSKQAKQMNHGQTAYAVSDLPVPNTAVNSDGRIRFGVLANRTDRSAVFDGVEVLSVYKDSPATHIRAMNGHIYSLAAPGLHVITHVNDVPVRANADLIKEVNAAGDIMMIRVRGLTTGRTDEYSVDLRGQSGKRVRLGASADATAFGTRFGGLQVREVLAGYPATRLKDHNGQRSTLVPYSHVILKVDGASLTSSEQFRDVIQNSPRHITLTVYDAISGTTTSYSAELLE
jgi:Caspase domain